MSDIRTKISNLIKLVEPFDDIEHAHINDALTWLASGVEIFRLEKPATPPKHLVSYSVLMDLKARKILLLDHKQAQKMLPSGGHIDVNELPLDAAKRELIEELAVEPKAVFESAVPFFVTVTEATGLTAKHLDVSLWYIFVGDSHSPVKSEGEEFNREFDGYHWLEFEEILSTPIENFDPHMHRFIKKLEKYL